MKQYSIYVLLGTALAWGQSTTTTYEQDVNGRKTAISKVSVSATGDQTVHRLNSPNGRPVPYEESSIKILSSGPTGKVSERVTKSYDDYGKLVGTERVRTEETIGTGGDSTVKETTFHTGTDGVQVEAQRRSIETRRRNGESTMTAVLERPDVNRAFAVAERRTTTTTGTADSQRSVEIVERPTPAGKLTVSLRRETDVVLQGDAKTSTTKEFQPKTGSAETLVRQTVATTTKKTNGSDVTETRLFVPGGSGRVQSANAPLELQEEQILEGRVAPDGSTTSVLSVRTQTSIGSNRLGSPRVVSETVCTGKCVEEAAPDNTKSGAAQQAKAK